MYNKFTENAEDVEDFNIYNTNIYSSHIATKLFHLTTTAMWK